MYNGIGLTTPRGSGTNGYVQKNWSHVSRKSNVEYRNEQKRVEAMGPPKARKPDKGILEHERKRKVELKIAEFEDAMEEQGYTEEEIEREVSALREKMMAEDLKAKENASDQAKRREKETHAMAAQKASEMDRMAGALGIGGDSRPGDSFNAEIQAERAEREKIQREQDKKRRHEEYLEREERRKQRSERERRRDDDDRRRHDRRDDRRRDDRRRDDREEAEREARREQGRKARDSRRSPERRPSGGGWDAKRSGRPSGDGDGDGGGGWDDRDRDAKRRRTSDDKEQTGDEAPAAAAKAEDAAPAKEAEPSKPEREERKEPEGRRKKRSRRSRSSSSSSSDTSSSSSSSSSRSSS